MDDRLFEDYIEKQDIGSIAKIPIPIAGKTYYLEIPLTTKDEQHLSFNLKFPWSLNDD